jgi:hypothetical protein
MEDLNIEEIKQLVLFYKQKSSDLEFNLLQMQIKLNRTESLSELPKVTSKTVDKK